MKLSRPTDAGDRKANRPADKPKELAAHLVAIASAVRDLILSIDGTLNLAGKAGRVACMRTMKPD